MRRGRKRSQEEERDRRKRETDGLGRDCVGRQPRQARTHVFFPLEIAEGIAGHRRDDREMGYPPRAALIRRVWSGRRCLQRSQGKAAGQRMPASYS